MTTIVVAEATVGFAGGPPSMRSRAQQVALGIVLIAVSGCGILADEKTPEDFCSTYAEEKRAFLERYSQSASATASSNDSLTQAFGGLAAGLESLGDAAVIFDKLVEVAPEDIEPDVVVVRDSLRSFAETVGSGVTDPLGQLAQNLMLSMTTKGSWERVGAYVSQNCGE